MDEPVTALPYHHAVARILEAENPAAFAALAARESTDAAVLEQALLRSTYRLDAAAHPEVHAAVARAATALGLTVPVDLYADETGIGANAELVFVPSRAVVIFSGSTLEILDPTELTAVAGHELAHHLLWTAEQGRHLAASRLLDAAETDARTPSEYLETARRLRFATELFADRGALRACGGLAAAVSSLVKMSTGLRTVDGAAYLRQAAEVDFGRAGGGTTHPETVLRAWALQERVERPATADDAVALALSGRVDLCTIGAAGQDTLVAVTRELLGSLLAVEALRREDVLALGRQYGVEPPVAPVAPPDLAAHRFPAETVRYLVAVLVDVATADPDAGADVPAQVLAVAERAGVRRDAEKTLVRELELSDRARTALAKRVDEIVAASNDTATIVGAP